MHTYLQLQYSVEGLWTRVETLAVVSKQGKVCSRRSRSLSSADRRLEKASDLGIIFVPARVQSILALTFELADQLLWSKRPYMYDWMNEQNETCELVSKPCKYLLTDDGQ
jgi:hypothetical protein